MSSFTNQPLVSIIMNCYNGDKYLGEAIDSVYAQTYENWEIIFWDNASADKSAEIAKSYTDKLKYFYGEKNIPLGAARNKALEQCNGDYIAFLDVDDLWMPDKLLKQVNYLEKNKDVLLCHTDGYFIYEDKPSTVKFSSNLKIYNNKVFEHIIKENFINWQTVFIKRDLSGNELLFKDNYFYSEDKELLLRLSIRGKFYYINEPLAYYRIHENNISWNIDYLINDTITLITDFSFELKSHNIKSRLLFSRLYRNVVLTLIRKKRYKEITKYRKYLFRYWDVKNIVLILIIDLMLYDIFLPLLEYYKKTQRVLNGQ